MSYARRMTRPDSNQSQIVDALRQASATVWVIGQPCDLLTYFRGRWQPLEIKPPDTTKKGTKRLRCDQERQTEFLRAYAVPVVRTVQDALTAVVGPRMGML
jgi:hypothetical protein